MQFLITFSTLHNLQDWVTTNFFGWKPKLASTSCLMNKIPAYPFPIYIYIYTSSILGSLFISFTIFGSLFFVLAQLLCSDYCCCSSSQFPSYHSPLPFSKFMILIRAFCMLVYMTDWTQIIRTYLDWGIYCCCCCFFTGLWSSKENFR